MSVKVVVADDHEVVRTGLKTLLADSQIEIVAAASSGPEAVHMALEHKPDVVLMDIRMPDHDGLDALDMLPRSGRPTPPSFKPPKPATAARPIVRLISNMPIIWSAIPRGPGPWTPGSGKLRLRVSWGTGKGPSGATRVF